jgi:metal-responsive CopG/Arc/MetJ family transcriptional regulator
MDVTVVHAHLPRELAEQLDAVSRDELRSRSNMVAALVAEGLRRRSADVEREESR